MKNPAQESDRIVRGKVMSVVYSQETNRYGDELIYTNATIRVAESLKGDRSDLVVKAEGGTINGITLTVSDSAKFRTGEEVLVFVKKDLQDYRPLRGSQFQIYHFQWRQNPAERHGNTQHSEPKYFAQFRKGRCNNECQTLYFAFSALDAVFFLDLVQSYTVLGYQWPKQAFRYYINPANRDINEADVVPAIKKGARAWTTWCRAAYAGTTTNHRAKNDGTNTIFFRQAEYGALASTYVFTKENEILDVDIVFWDNPWKFYAGTTGCDDGFYITDLATHEFGHAIGLGHSRAKDSNHV